MRKLSPFYSFTHCKKRFSTIIAFFPAKEMTLDISFKHTTHFSNNSFLSPTSVLWHWQVTFSEMMVLALISTACISNIICSLQAMLIYARISNAMEAEDVWPAVDFYPYSVNHCGMLAAHINQSLDSRIPAESTDLRLNCCICNCILRCAFCCNVFQCR